ncbi:LysR family transcriptional regulator [Arthrobacter sp. EpRS71]|nr:LysR family transcriptional regulator [Arthrobacter sp. EpRS71]
MAEAEHVTETAARLHVSQSTLSRGIQRVEQQFGAQLFDRSARKLALNGFGEVARTHVLRALGELEAAEQRISAMRDPGRGVISLAFVSSLGSWLVPEIIGSFNSIEPQTTFQLEGGAADQVLDLVRNQVVDAALLAPRPADTTFDWVDIVDEPLALVVPENHHVAEAGRLQLQEVMDESFVGLRPEFGLRQIGDRLCAAAGFKPRMVVEATEITTLWGLVSAGLGMAILPRLEGPLAQGTRQIDIADPTAHRTVGLAWLMGRRQPAPVARFLDFMHDRHPTPEK